jgi:hypothetical protein
MEPELNNFSRRRSSLVGLGDLRLAAWTATAPAFGLIDQVLANETLPRFRVISIGRSAWKIFLNPP